jgi:hypothetical protein
MNKGFETHTLATLAERFRGLISRNTISAWLDQGRFKPEMAKQERGRIRYLFKTQALDSLLSLLEQEHDQRVRRQTESEKAFKEIRDKARLEALGIIRHNLTSEVLRGQTSPKRERNPALSDMDAVAVASSIQSGWGTK